jgi:hypothetical protein
MAICAPSFCNVTHECDFQMDNETLSRIFDGLIPTQREEFLISLAFNLTVVARNTYVAGTDEVDRPRALRGIVEASHKVVGILNSKRDLNGRAFDFFDSLHQTAKHHGCDFELENAISFVLERFPQ